ncbi:MAG: glycosyltransferase [Candidatus Dormibacteraeota bacterium]|nr:glycosyltransferase [Candidatus Dormibacteraeota bacterium]
MKREILAGAGWDAKDVEALTGRIESLERDLAQRCDICIAVSDDDAQAHQAMGAGNVIVARNGASRRPSSAASERRWKARIAARGIRHTALFVGSAHPPNWVGFMSTVGTRLGFLAPDTCVLLAGGVADYMHEHFRGRTVDQVTMWRRLWPLGRVTDSDLAALLRVADVILLPITEGGGSNLKTAEAILSGRPVVATDYALRSFEDLMDLPNIHAARTPEEFRAAMLHAFSRPAGQRSAEQVRRSEAVLWERCLEGVAEAVASL